MTRYLIKVTYLEGPHYGKSYLLRKGGFCTDDDSIQWEDTTYKTRGIALAQCRRLTADNELSRKIERQDEAIMIQRGGKPKSFYIYDSFRYEPYACEVIPD